MEYLATPYAVYGSTVALAGGGRGQARNRGEAKEGRGRRMEERREDI